MASKYYDHGPCPQLTIAVGMTDAYLIAMAREWLPALVAELRQRWAKDP